ncbi:MAG: hypothetical protein WCM93_02280 [Bacteroidota bacterium]
MTARSALHKAYRFIRQSEAEANKTSQAEARGDPQASKNYRQAVDVLLLNRTTWREAAKADKEACREEEGGTAKNMTSFHP